jgi:putative FmdB family regulatory protein
MPTYDYYCKKCDLVCEINHKISDEMPKTCKTCNEKMTKQISSVLFQLKGKGWYKTDYNKSNKEPK